ncbi:MAG TPA: acyl-CoA desaturase [Tahibacter sp.]|nr:acyl-CoA desaturase [Tahibacter sp.]
MSALPASLAVHRVRCATVESVCNGKVRWSPVKSMWFLGMAAGAVVGGLMTFSWAAFALFVVSTGIVLLFGHSLGSHRKLIHDSFQCPKWLERTLVYGGTMVGLAGPISLVQQHDLRDYAQRMPRCHDYLRNGRRWFVDAWWQLNCDLVLDNEPAVRIEPRIANDRFYRLLESTWMAQQLPWALAFYAWGGWGFVFWGICARVTAGVFGHWLIGYFAHNHGPMQRVVAGAAVQGHNVRFTSLITMGECWHNNHHAYPGSARLGLDANEWDPGWWCLVALQRVGLVWDVRLPADLPPRDELVVLPPRPRRAGLVDAWRLCFRTWTRDVGTQPALLVRWPAKFLSRQALAALFGPNVRLRHEPQLHRLVLCAGKLRLAGISAIAIAAAQRRPWLALPVALGMPLLMLHCRRMPVAGTA